ncbi:hypothetical protein D918_04385 [Trichuris suis]|nr:hypothetical protein D918_04385 [Trichuris suis]
MNVSNPVAFALVRIATERAPFGHCNPLSCFCSICYSVQAKSAADMKLSISRLARSIFNYTEMGCSTRPMPYLENWYNFKGRRAQGAFEAYALASSLLNDLVSSFRFCLLFNICLRQCDSFDYLMIVVNAAQIILFSPIYIADLYQEVHYLDGLIEDPVS